VKSRFDPFAKIFKLRRNSVLVSDLERLALVVDAFLKLHFRNHYEDILQIRI
jgi:hypothetical protein